MTDVKMGPGETLMALFSPQGKQNPYPLYESLRALGPMLPLGPQVVLVGYQECARALRETRLLSTDAAVQDQILPGWRDHSSWRWLTRNMLFSNDPDHERFRRFFGSAFAPRRIAEFRPVVERVVDGLVDRLGELGAGGAPVDFMSEFAFRLPMAVMGELLGIPDEDRMGFRNDIGDITLALEPIRDLAVLEPGDAAMDRLAEYFTDLVAKRRADPADDLVSAMVAARDASGDLTDEELVANFMLLLVAGTEAPMDLVGNAMRLAIDHPEQARTIVDDPRRAPAFIEETLRFDPAVHALNRLAAEDLEFFGLPVGAGTKVTLLIGAANRDPRRFAEPGRFDITRPNNQALTFSAGAHYCLGVALARMQGEVAFPRLLGRFPGIALAGEPSYRDQLVQRGYAHLPVTPG
ncbi:MAG TPA: cytochrome P450 [Mycobacteriales bacterium]